MYRNFTTQITHIAYRTNTIVQPSYRGKASTIRILDMIITNINEIAFKFTQIFKYIVDGLEAVDVSVDIYQSKAHPDSQPPSVSLNNHKGISNPY